MIQYQPSLVDASLRTIERGQTRHGAYLAAPTFPTYRYSWFRDGAFIARAMDAWERHDSASAFHTWALRTLDRELQGIGEIAARPSLPPDRQLHTRYAPDGSAGREDWPNFQLDGLGTWLWAYRDHVARLGTTPSAADLATVARLAAYLRAAWPQPNFDCWEEHGDRLHPSTLGAIAAGLRAAADLLQDPSHGGAADVIASYVLTHGVSDGTFVKHIGSTSVDGNLLWLVHGYDIARADTPLACRTVERVLEDLQDPDGGLRRYRGDTYYGGGSWILLTALLAEVEVQQGRHEAAARRLRWIERQATEDGELPEQTAHHLQAPEYLEEWELRWGPSACPLLWSHASYLSLVASVRSQT